MANLGYLLLGVITGVVSGLFGIGGGSILIPALIYWFGLTQHQAQGTTLAIMVLPIGLLAAAKYYTEGNVNLSLVAFICAGFFLGGGIGACFAHRINEVLLKRLFGVLLLAISLKMIFWE